MNTGSTRTLRGSVISRKYWKGVCPRKWHQDSQGEEALVVAMVTDVRDDSVTPTLRSWCDAHEGLGQGKGLIGSGPM